MKKRATSSNKKKTGTAPGRTSHVRASAHDDSNPLAQSAPARLAGLLQLGQTQVQWRDDDLAAILKHQLTQPLAPVLEQYLPASGLADATATGRKKHAIKTFGDLFLSPSPSAEMLDVVRQYARDCRTADEKELPPVIAGAIYWSAIAAAIASGAQCHSKLSKADLDVGLKWLADQKWVTAPLQKLAAKAAGKI